MTVFYYSLCQPSSGAATAARAAAPPTAHHDAAHGAQKRLDALDVEIRLLLAGERRAGEVLGSRAAADGHLQLPKACVEEGLWSQRGTNEMLQMKRSTNAFLLDAPAKE